MLHEEITYICVTRIPGTFFLPEYIAATWHMCPPDKGGRQGIRGDDHLCGVLTQVASVGEMPGSRMPGGST